MDKAKGAPVNFENALISRKILPLSETHVLVDEKWDLNHPESPFVSMQPLNPYNSPGMRQTVMTHKEAQFLLSRSPDAGHASDCALHNGPALPTGPCDCGFRDPGQ